MLEILSTRIAKIHFGYNFQFVIISLAMLGLGAGGIAVFYWTYLKTFRGRSLLCGALLYLLGILATFTCPLFKNVFGFLAIKIIFLCCLAASYFAAGIIMSLIFSVCKERIFFYYTSSMLGAAIGSLLIVVSLDYLGTESTALLVLIIALVLFCLWCFFDFRKNRGAVILSLFSLIILSGTLFIQLTTKTSFSCSLASMARNARGDRIIRNDSNAMAYLETHELKNKAGLVSHIIFIDGMGHTSIPRLQAWRGQETLKSKLSFFPYLLRRFKNPLIIGSGGGYEVAVSLYGGSDSITAVEVNSLISRITKALVADEYNIYRRKEVRLFVDEGRNFIARSKEKYDLINLTTAKRYGGVGVKDLIFIENYLYTKEAFHEYIDHLEDDGLLFISDVDFFINKFFDGVTQVLLERKMDPFNSVVIIRVRKDAPQNSMAKGEDNFRAEPTQAAILVKKNGFSEKEKENIVLNSMGLFQAISVSSADVERAKVQLATTDDCPFFWRMKSSGKISSEFIESRLYSMTTLIILFVFALGIYACALIFPCLMYSGSRVTFFNQSLFFSCIAFGYIILELTFIQRFTYFLINPTYSVAVTLSTILFWSGIGSWLVENMCGGRGRLSLIIWALICMGGLLNVLLSYILAQAVHWGILYRCLLVIGLLGVPALLMGMVFPLGLQMNRRIMPECSPFMWGINGIASVVGGFISFLSSLLFGFKITLFIGLFFYLVALFFSKSEA